MEIIQETRNSLLFKINEATTSMAFEIEPEIIQEPSINNNDDDNDMWTEEYEEEEREVAVDVKY